MTGMGLVLKQVVNPLRSGRQPTRGHTHQNFGGRWVKPGQSGCLFPVQVFNTFYLHGRYLLL
jgi:hypothetical protein